MRRSSIWNSEHNFTIYFMNLDYTFSIFFFALANLKVVGVSMVFPLDSNYTVAWLSSTTIFFWFVVASMVRQAWAALSSWFSIVRILGWTSQILFPVVHNLSLSINLLRQLLVKKHRTVLIFFFPVHCALWTAGFPVNQLLHPVVLKFADFTNKCFMLNRVQVVLTKQYRAGASSTILEHNFN